MPEMPENVYRAKISMFRVYKIHLGVYTHQSNHHLPSPVVVHNGVESVCYGKYGAVLEGRPDGRLYKVIRLKVNGGRGLVQDQNQGSSEKGTGQAHQLTLAHAVGN